MTAARSVSAAVLRNRGVPVTLHVLDEQGQRVFTDADEPQTEEKNVQFPNDVIADIETYWGDLDGWQDALEKTPRKALSATLAFVFGWVNINPATGDAVPDIRRAGRAMQESESASYSTAIGCAFMLAEGIPVESVGEVLATGLREVEEAEAELAALDMKKLLAPDDEPVADLPDTPTAPDESTTGPSSSELGSDTDSTPSSSGDSPPLRSAS